jgi:hypothetical protein
MGGRGQEAIKTLNSIFKHVGMEPDESIISEHGHVGYIFRKLDAVRSEVDIIRDEQISITIGSIHISVCTTP